MRALARAREPERIPPLEPAPAGGDSILDRLADALNQAAETGEVMDEVLSADGRPTYAGEPGFEAALERHLGSCAVHDQELRAQLLARELGEVEPTE